jgi:hypothetical protein
MIGDAPRIKRFQAKWTPVRRPKMQSKKGLAFRIEACEMAGAAARQHDDWSAP